MGNDYAELDGKIEDLKIFAYDAYIDKKLRESNLASDFHRIKEHNIYIIGTESTRNVPDGTDRTESGTLEIARPTKVGGKASGGGRIMKATGSGHRFSALMKVDYEAWFSQVCDRVERAIKSWRDLPDPETISQLFSIDFNNISTMLAVPDQSVGAVSGGASGKSDIKAAFDMVPTGSPTMAGKTWDAFREKFYTKLPSAINATNALAHYLASTIQAESKMFEQARKNVIDLVVNAASAFDSVAHDRGKSVNWKLLLKIGVVAAEAATAVVSGGATAGVAGASFVVGGLKTMSEVAAVDSEKTGTDYDSVMRSFESSLTSIGDQVRDSEEAIKKSLVDNAVAALKNPGHYDLTLVPITHGPSDELAIKDRDNVNTVINTQMPQISTGLSDAAHDINELGVKFGPVVGRNDEIGIGRLGPSEQFVSLAKIIADYLGELSIEAAMGGKNLEAAVNDIDAHDESSQKKLKQIQNDIEKHTADAD